jgi:hypothetical protein
MPASDPASLETLTMRPWPLARAPRLRQQEQPQGPDAAEPSQTSRRGGRPTGRDLIEQDRQGGPVV